MSETDKPILPEKQVKIYLAVLAVLLVVAVVVTVFTAYQQQEQLAQEEEPGISEMQDAAEEPQESEQTRPVQHNFLDANSQIEEKSEAESSVPASEESMPEDTADLAEEPVAEEPAVQVEAFDPESDRMIWPVSGNVLMDFSPDALIYDATLDLYRTNDCISIGAQDAEDVVAAAAGIVEAVGRSDDLGNYVVLNNGNGYETTYGQLSDEVMVEIGEAVAQGETIGRISEPTWYSAALGTHLTFSVKASGEMVNPLDYLENSLDE